MTKKRESAGRKRLIMKTRWEYYASNIIGLVLLVGFSISFLFLSFGPDGFNLTSVYFLLALVAIVILPFAIISFFSSIKTAEITQKDLVISYVFQKHQNVISFSAIREIQPHNFESASGSRSKKLRDTFRLILKDGRSFEFRRAQFDHQYNAFRAACYRQKLAAA